MESCLRIGCGEGPKGMGVSAGEALIVGGGQGTNQRTPLPTGERRHCGVWGRESQAGWQEREGSQSCRLGCVGGPWLPAWLGVERDHPWCPCCPPQGRIQALI